MSDEDDLLDNDEVTPEEQAFMEGYDEEEDKEDEFYLAEDDDEQQEEEDEFMQQGHTADELAEEQLAEE